MPRSDSICTLPLRSDYAADIPKILKHASSEEQRQVIARWFEFSHVRLNNITVVDFADEAERVLECIRYLSPRKETK